MMRELAQVAFGVIKSGKPFNPALHGLDLDNSIYVTAKCPNDRKHLSGSRLG